MQLAQNCFDSEAGETTMSHRCGSERNTRNAQENFVEKTLRKQQLGTVVSPQQAINISINESLGTQQFSVN
jgi:hypothetical protein